MGNTDNAATITPADVLELDAIGDAIFAEWYPDHRPGDPIPTMPPESIMREARELAYRHLMIASNQRALLAA